MERSVDIVVVGGGIVGCAAAYFLAGEGAKVIIVERDSLGSGASGHGAGGFGVPLHYNEPLEHALFMRKAINFLKWVAPTVAEEAGVDILWRDVAWLEVARTQPTWGYMQEWAPKMDQRLLDSDEVLRLEPRLSPAIWGGVVEEGNGQLDSYRLTLAYAKAAEKRGAEVVIEEARGLQRSGERVTGVVTSRGAISCDSVVLTMGAWMSRAGKWAGFPMPISPLKGEILSLKYQNENEFWPYWIVGYDTTPGEELATYVHMRADNLVSAGSTAEMGLYDNTPTEKARDGILGRVVRLMPSLADAELVAQVGGPRPSPPDGTTVLGPVPGWERLYMAVSAPGIMCSAFIGRIVKDLVFDRPLPVSIDAFHPKKLAEPATEVFGFRKFLPDPVI